MRATLDAYPDEPFAAHVITIIPSADREKATVQVRIGFDALDARILPDMGVKVAFLSRRGRRVERAASRRSAAAHDPGAAGGDPRQPPAARTSWSSTAEGLLERRAVRLGADASDPATVIAGLAAGERVVIEGPGRLDGRREGAGSRGTEAQERPLRALRRQTGGIMETLVNIRDVHKTFTRGDEKIDVLQGLSVGIAKGEFLALMGPSGSGKSTLLNLIGGLDRPTSGVVEVGGVRIDQLSEAKLAAWRARHIGFVFQMYNLLPALDRRAQRRAAAAAHVALAARSAERTSRPRSPSSASPTA